MKMKRTIFTFTSPIKTPQKFQVRKTGKLHLLEETLLNSQN